VMKCQGASLAVIEKRPMPMNDLGESEALLNWIRKEASLAEDGGSAEEDPPVQMDPECPKGQWWHLRGQRCVDNKCRGGNKMRNVDTGECIRKSGRKYNSSPIYYFSRSSLRRFIPHRMYRGMGK